MVSLIGGCAIFLLALAVIFGVVNTVILATVVSEGKQKLEAAPDEIHAYIEANADQFVADHLQKVMPEIVQSAVLALMLGEMNGASPEATPATTSANALTPPAAAADEWVPGPPPVHPIDPADCDVTSAELCNALKTTCMQYHICHDERTTSQCRNFVLNLSYICSINRCDLYNNQGMCNRINNLCTNRQMALFSPHARSFMESELIELCSLIH